jgi:hypothetical protein
MNKINFVFSKELAYYKLLFENVWAKKVYYTFFHLPSPEMGVVVL